MSVTTIIVHRTASATSARCLVFRHSSAIVSSFLLRSSFALVLCVICADVAYPGVDVDDVDDDDDDDDDELYATMAIITLVLLCHYG